MKFYQKRGFALVVLVLAILDSCVYGISKKPADLPTLQMAAAVGQSRLMAAYDAAHPRAGR